MFASVSVPKTIKEGGGEGRWCTLSFSNSLSLTKDRIFGKKKSTHCHEWLMLWVLFAKKLWVVQS